MPCAGPDHSCNTLVTIRSPLGQVRLGAPHSAHPSPRPIWLLARAYLAIREAFAHRQQRRALDALDERLRNDAGISKREAMREVSRPFWK